MQGQPAPTWLDTDWLLGQFGTHRANARRAWTQFVMQGRGLPSPLLATRHQLLLGDDDFVKRLHADFNGEQLRELSLAHKRSVALSLCEYAEQFPDRNEAMAQAYRSGAYKMAEIAMHFGVHYMTVSRAVRGFEAKRIARQGGVLEC